jgi:diketogulonate reductase-like aldo/keto reductase
MCTKEQERVTWKTAWRNLEEAMAAGQALAIGVSNFHMHDLEQLLDMADAKVSVVQNWMDPFNQDTAVREFCKRHGIVYMAYSSFGTQWQHKLKGRNPVFESAELQAIADKHSTTIAQVVLSWVMQVRSQA